jgi:hypothetical protein
MDLEIGPECLAQAKPDQRMGIDHEALWARGAQGSILYPAKSASYGRKAL